MGDRQVPLLSTVRESLWLRLAVALTLLILLIGIVGGAVTLAVTDTIRDDVDGDFRLQAEAEAGEIREWYDGNSRFVRSISDSQLFEEGGDSEITAFLNREVDNAPSVRTIHYVDIADRTIRSSTNGARVGTGVNASLAVNDRTFTDYDDTALVGPFGAPDGATVVAFLSPVRTSPEHLLVTIVEVEEFDERFRQPIAGGFTQVIDPANDIVFSGATGSTSPTERQLSRLREGVGGETGIRQLGLSGDERYVAAVTPVDVGDANWLLVKYAPTDNAYSLARTIRTGLLAFVFVALVGVLGIGWRFGRGTVREVTALSAAARRVTDGEYDVEFPSDRSDELGRLGTSLAEMRDALADRISELESTKAAVDEANAELDTQRTMISVLNRVLRHNLRNAGHVIRARAELLASTEPTERREHTDQIIETVEELLDQASKAREIESLASENRKTGPVDLVPFVERAIAEATGAATVERSTPEEAYVRGHPALETAVLNLVENAIEHTDAETPTVAISITVGADRTTLSIADDGPGIPEAEASVIEEAAVEGPLEHSSGLGLWTTNWIVEHVGGTLTFEESRLGGTEALLAFERVPSPSETDESDSTDS
ncbi:sensor histidine kinase [Halapricum salinum]|uniref:histidine kinase n=1 Tax=Halapricum salinum TaxID=1457250 RepID=A0A4D6HE53_9EURY|nr:HAMP domain-containing sensor histidine kinase [Halapricum salinum]QCC51865.1 sensor histidine kinase [Halapricum salinum]